MQMLEDSNKHFKAFAKVLETAIEKYGDLPESEVEEKQKSQLESLSAKEIEFRYTLIRHPWGLNAYRAFVKYICEEKKNILAARPFFRERQAIFTSQISKILKQRAERGLFRFHFNYQFVQFILKSRTWPKGCKLWGIAKEIENLRTEIVEINMPLAISRARIFWSRTPRSQLSFMDLVQISCEGLISAVDKFVLPYSRVFRSVAIGRMVGNFIESYNETLIHFYPGDKRKIYRANKQLRHFDGVDFEELVNKVNDGVEENGKTNSNELLDLMAAASCVSVNSISPKDPDGVETIEKVAAPDFYRADIQVEKMNDYRKLMENIGGLSVLEKKFLQLKGIDIHALQ